ncbi:MAG: hypothetical protein QM496_08215 [Verrucomicrobiota bacterium]
MGNQSQALFLLKVAVVLTLIWAVVWGVMSVSGVFRETPEKVIAYMEANPLSEVEDENQRREIISGLADRLNRLDHIQINEFQSDPDKDRRRDFFKEMSAEEQHLFMERRIGKAFNQMMNAFNEMERSERKRLVERTLKRMRDDDDERLGLQRLEESDPAATEKIVNEGLRAYYQNASAETKLDLAPLMEQMQRNLQALRYKNGK